MLLVVSLITFDWWPSARRVAEKGRRGIIRMWTTQGWKLMELGEDAFPSEEGEPHWRGYLSLSDGSSHFVPLTSGRETAKLS